MQFKIPHEIQNLQNLFEIGLDRAEKTIERDWHWLLICLDRAEKTLKETGTGC